MRILEEAPPLRVYSSGNQVDGLPLGLITSTEGISVGVIRMLSQLVGFGPVERAIIKSDVFF